MAAMRILGRHCQPLNSGLARKRGNAAHTEVLKFISPNVADIPYAYSLDFKMKTANEVWAQLFLSKRDCDLVRSFLLKTAAF